MSRLKEAIGSIPLPDEGVRERALDRLRNQARPTGSLGVLEDVGAKLAAVSGTLDVCLQRKVVVTCAGDHGIVAEGVSLFPQDVTWQMVANFVNGGASINVLAKHAGARVIVADLGVNHDFDPALPICHKKVRRGTANFRREPAMTREQAVTSVEAGIEIVDELVADGGLDLLGTGDMGIGNTSPSTAIIAAFSGLPVAELTGRGTGLGDEALQHKIDVIDAALRERAPNPKDPIDVLAKVGGCEIGGLAGLVIGAAAHGVPVVCDGLISTAGALIAYELAPAVSHYLFASHRSVEVGHRFMHQRLGVEPLLDLRFRLGEGTGAAVAFHLMDAATRVLANIKTFAEVAIADAQD
ncbi:MAG: nicotinate-nucleotide--dimethylbenzimidazole phosphoribosyltransferase [Lentisphaerae bacterium]|jgi:nicotinate-nucleotide--dimethylbenzimidazole phosphoribosyltransferase|nr:nicotinate-nucleotide--dimethylbenzimidazole phosphoribosyltransferase [Lentisphaerota bacterium]MBT7061447.1 nicotinate-nucleotide--dimethylbenzimidazole phosphoribosyltransferase [Lentisphaerota bacterium]MBT7844195.1 nicotinate-nucleotide--dimethylbenzimidazole phosphoribosyltransferase [Lentisphaerota bacterium]